MPRAALPLALNQHFLSCTICDYDACIPCASQPAEPRDDLQCVCEGIPAEFDGTYIGCDGCGRWVHACCAGYTPAEAESLESYLCLLCSCKRGEKRPKPTKATLLICPQSIVSQWRQEAARHIHGDALKVCTYTGIRDALHHGAKSPQKLASLHPDYLDQFDLVLTTFEVLRSELDHTPPGAGTADAAAMERSLRGGSRDESSSRVLSPLLSLKWWRLVIDEAQMVESGTAKAAAMALKLSAVNRWAVSGTPMGRGRLADLHGLMAFLQVYPWSEASWWNHAIEMPLTLKDAGAVVAASSSNSSTAAAAKEALARRGAFDEAEGRLLSILHVLMWRNSKMSVLDQLDLPPQSELTHNLTLSSIERHFYEKQARECQSAAQKALTLHARQVKEEEEVMEVEERKAANGGKRKAPSPANGEPPKPKPATAARAGQTAAAAERALNLSTQGVLRLRQACCHPQLGSFGIKGHKRRGGQNGNGSGPGGGGGGGMDDPMSMRAILGKLIEEEKNKCEEEQRKVLFNLSALAGMDAMLGKHADAAEKYHTALEVSQGNRSSMSLDGSVEATLVGPASLRFEGPNGPRPLARPLGPIRWTLASAANGHAEASTSDDWSVVEMGSGGRNSGEVWLRIELSKPKRLSEIRIRSSSSKHIAFPRSCVLHATSGAESAGVFVEVGSFELPRPSSAADDDDAGGNEWSSFCFYRPHKSKQYRLVIQEWWPPLAESPSSSQDDASSSSAAPPPATAIMGWSAS